ncbi:hypothetical protein M3Y95_00410800 [Aphelenchoides besseyi]|nr:hypothetical protein M3Y95_00410800 [Aphelenchoides besseyi]
MNFNTSTIENEFSFQSSVWSGFWLSVAAAALLWLLVVCLFLLRQRSQRQTRGEQTSLLRNSVDYDRSSSLLNFKQLPIAMRVLKQKRVYISTNQYYSV